MHYENAIKHISLVFLLFNVADCKNLEGTSWFLQYYMKNDKSIHYLDTSNYEKLKFEDHKLFYVKCPHFSGNYEQNGRNGIKFISKYMTKLACQVPSFPIKSALDSAFAYNLSKNYLDIQYKDLEGGTCEMHFFKEKNK